MFDGHVATVDFGLVQTITLMYNTVQKSIDELRFTDASGSLISKLTLACPISTPFDSALPFKVSQYQMTAVFTGNLDFLAHFLGHQGASAKWLCMFCLACQDRLCDTFKCHGDNAPFPQRKGAYSIQKSFEIFKSEYLDLTPDKRTKAKREHVTQMLSHSIVASPLADIPLDTITCGTMHVILVLTKKIYAWMLK